MARRDEQSTAMNLMICINNEGYEASLEARKLCQLACRLGKPRFGVLKGGFLLV
jgi:hypothetical protein